MPKAMLTALWLMWLFVVWFVAMVMHAMMFEHGGFHDVLWLLGAYWLVYLTGLWLEKTWLTDTAWAMLLGYAIGMLRLLDKLPEQSLLVDTLAYLPRTFLGPLAVVFILLFTGLLPLIAQHIINTHKAQNRVLGRDD